jgi:hypothetical protein
MGFGLAFATRPNWTYCIEDGSASNKGPSQDEPSLSLSAN